MTGKHGMCLCLKENRCINRMEFYVAKNILKTYLMTWKNAYGMLSGKSRNKMTNGAVPVVTSTCVCVC